RLRRSTPSPYTTLFRSRRPASASAAARLTTAAVLPTPPLLFPTATRGGIAPPPVIRYSRHTGAPQHRNQVIRHFVGVTRTASDAAAVLSGFPDTGGGPGVFGVAVV